MLAPPSEIPTLQELRAVGLLALPVIIFSLAGFVPSWLQFFTVGQLHLDPWFEVAVSESRF